MPHFRHRILEELISKSVGWAPIVGITGARQTGKTTLLKRMSASALSFDDPALEEQFRDSGLAALEGLKRPLLLDEVQKYPPVFDLLKLAVDQDRRPGQFLITGSMRFSSKKGIRESLTGRGQFWEILPFTIQECHEREFDDLLALFLASRRGLADKLRALERRVWCKESKVLEYLDRGGLPGICFLRDAAQRHRALDSYLDTSLARDLPMLYPTRLRFAQVMDLYREAVRDPTAPLNLSLLARKLATSVPTVKAVLQGLEGIYLLRRHGRSCFAEDPALSSSGGRGGTQVLRFVFTVARAWTAYLKDHQATLSEHATRGGSHVPFVLRTRNGGVLGLAAVEGELPTEKSLKGLYSLARTEPKAVLVCVHRGERAYVHRERVLAVPWTWLV